MVFKNRWSKVTYVVLSVVVLSGLSGCSKEARKEPISLLGI